MPTRRAPTSRVSTNRALRVSARYGVLFLLSLIVLFPVYMTIVRALSAPIPYLNAGQPFRPVQPEWDVFSRAFTEADFGRSLAVSVAMTLVIVCAQLVTSILAAYAFAFMRFPFRRLLFLLFMATLMLPIEVTLIPNVRFIREMGWNDSLIGLTAPFLATAFGTFLLRQGFLGIPRDLLDASQLDGYGHWGFLTRVAMPLNRPVIASFGLLSFLGAWNQYLWPRAITTEKEWETIQIGIRSVAASNVDALNVGVAAALLASIPLVILLLVFQRQIVRGLTAGAVKG